MQTISHRDVPTNVETAHRTVSTDARLTAFRADVAGGGGGIEGDPDAAGKGGRLEITPSAAYATTISLKSLVLRHLWDCCIPHVFSHARHPWESCPCGGEERGSICRHGTRNPPDRVASLRNHGCSPPLSKGQAPRKHDVDQRVTRRPDHCHGQFISTRRGCEKEKFSKIAEWK